MDTTSKNRQDNASIDTLNKVVDNILIRVDQLEQRLDYEEKNNIRLLEKNLDIAVEIDELQQREKQRESELKKLERENQALKRENTKLRDKIYRKNSRNSSIPPLPGRGPTWPPPGKRRPFPPGVWRSSRRCGQTDRSYCFRRAGRFARFRLCSRSRCFFLAWCWYAPLGRFSILSQYVIRLVNLKVCQKPPEIADSL